MGAGGADAKLGSSDHHSRARAGLEWERLGVGRATSAGGRTANRSRGSTAAAMGIWVRRWDWEAVSKDGPQQSESRSSRERGERDRWVRRTPKSKSGGCSGGGDWEAVMMAKASRRLLKKKDADAKESRERVELRRHEGSSKNRMQTPKKVESGSSANRSNNGPEQSKSREQVERETKDRCRERASKIGKPARPTDGQYKVDEDNTGVDVEGVRKEARDQGERKMSRAA